ncbi:ABC transporter permease, partial [Staphylococcus pasteuri]|uniref:ABC transporter permease n=2 Tax=Staphylococcus TaxID=1279 RepID=UPI0030BF4365
LGKSLYIEGQGFKIVGIANSSGQSMMALQGDNSVKMPSKTFSQYMGNLTQDMPTLQLNLDKDANKKDVAKKVEKQLNKKGSGTSDG